LDQALFADVPGERILVSPREPPGPADLGVRTNLAVGSPPQGYGQWTVRPAISRALVHRPGDDVEMVRRRGSRRRRVISRSWASTRAAWRWTVATTMMRKRSSP